MRISALALAAALALSPAHAQNDGTSLMEEGAKLFLRGLMSEMEPALDEMGRALKELEPALREMGPALRELVDLMGDVRNYDAPRRLPNGDILILRKPDAPPPPLATLPDTPPEIEL
jgi:hypothetical protein